MDKCCIHSIVLEKQVLRHCDVLKNTMSSINNQTITHIGEQNTNDARTFLGIYIDRHLTWKKHIKLISFVRTKATSVIIVNEPGQEFHCQSSDKASSCFSASVLSPYNIFV